MAYGVTELTNPVQNELAQRLCTISYVHWVWTTVQNVLLVACTHLDAYYHALEYLRTAIVISPCVHCPALNA